MFLIIRGDSIKDALKNEEPLDLNFVYGSTKGNTFIPILCQMEEM